MRIQIKNLAKIKNADICIDGITVIAGNNNTGKTTIGKALYATYNSLYKLNEKIEQKRRNEIQEDFYSVLNEFLTRNALKQKNVEHRPRFRTLRMAESDFLSAFSECSLEDITHENLSQIFFDIFSKYGIEVTSEKEAERINEVVTKIISRKNDDDYKVSLELIGRFFKQIFDSQIQSLSSDQKETEIHLTIKNSKLVLRFRENECITKEADFDILHEAFFIDDPFIIDDLSYAGYSSSERIREQMADKLGYESKDLMEGIFDAVNAKENLKDIYGILNQVTDGEVTVKQGEPALQSDRYVEPINFSNLSAGLKAFVIIKILLEKGMLKRKDVLILDEPEVHLHPDWQLQYAQIIVLLQKKFNLSILVTTHSRDFLEAIELYSKQYEIEDRCNYYMSVEENGTVTFKHVKDSIHEIYGQMITASMLLDKLRYELEDSDD